MTNINRCYTCATPLEDRIGIGLMFCSLGCEYMYAGISEQEAKEDYQTYRGYNNE